MIPTFIGAAQLLIGLILLAVGSSSSMLVFMLSATLFGGSASILLPGLGGSSIPPSDFALCFVALRVALPSSRLGQGLVDGFTKQAALAFFVFYGVTSAYICPRLFANKMDVPPLRFAGLTYIFDVVPLGPSSQNITTAVYIIGTFATALTVYAFCTREGTYRVIVKTGVVLSWIHIYLGISGAAFGTQYAALLAFFRNGAYAQLNNDYQGIVRLTGIFPEASAYASYAFVWFVFMFECWWRDVMPRRTGITAAALAVTLVASTSSSAYVSLVAFSLLLVLRMLFTPADICFSKVAPMVAVSLVGLILGLGVAAASPDVYDKFADLLKHMTVDKSQSSSGLQRAFWALKGLEAFKVSHGVGIGLGSFRSSSLITAILGSTGVFGFAAFMVYVLQAVKPFRLSTYIGIADEESAVGAAASWTLIGILIPASIAAASANPGEMFATFGAAALALRKKPLAGIIDPRGRGMIMVPREAVSIA